MKPCKRPVKTRGYEKQARTHYFLQGYFVKIRGAFRGASLGTLICLPPYPNPTYCSRVPNMEFSSVYRQTHFTLLRYSVSKPVTKQNPPQCGSFRPALETTEAGDQDGLSASLSCSIRCSSQNTGCPCIMQVFLGSQTPAIESACFDTWMQFRPLVAIQDSTPSQQWRGQSLPLPF